MVAREHSLDPTFNLDFNARADSLTEDERQEVLSVRTWSLCNHDLRRPQRFPGRALGGDITKTIAHWAAKPWPPEVHLLSPMNDKEHLKDRGPVSRKPRKRLGPLKPFLVHLHLKTEKCIRQKLPGCMKRSSIHIKNTWIKKLVIVRFEILLWLYGARKVPWTFEKRAPRTGFLIACENRRPSSLSGQEWRRTPFFPG